MLFETAVAQSVNDGQGYKLVLSNKDNPTRMDTLNLNRQVTVHTISARDFDDADLIELVIFGKLPDTHRFDGYCKVLNDSTLLVGEYVVPVKIIKQINGYAPKDKVSPWIITPTYLFFGSTLTYAGFRGLIWAWPFIAGSNFFIIRMLPAILFGGIAVTGLVGIGIGIYWMVSKTVLHAYTLKKWDFNVIKLNNPTLKL
jgi:hypothetical protein